MLWEFLAVVCVILTGSFCLLFVRYRRLQRRSRAQAALWATLGHELKTPLNGILGFAELLKLGDYTSEEQKQYIDAIALSGHSLLEIINNMLDSAKLHNGQTQLHLRTVNINELTNQLTSILSSLLQAKELHLNIEIPDHLPMVKIDPDRIRQILVNLLSNAIKYSDRGTISLEIAWQKTSARHGTLCLIVSDQGPGIPDEFQKKIFDAFVQQPQHAQAGQGTGLGLYITNSLVRLMNGSIQLESKLGKGSRFTVILPAIEFL